MLPARGEGSPSAVMDGLVMAWLGRAEALVSRPIHESMSPKQMSLAVRPRLSVLGSGIGLVVRCFDFIFCFGFLAAAWFASNVVVLRLRSVVAS